MQVVRASRKDLGSAPFARSSSAQMRSPAVRHWASIRAVRACGDSEQPVRPMKMSPILAILVTISCPSLPTDRTEAHERLAAPVHLFETLVEGRALGHDP